MKLKPLANSLAAGWLAMTLTALGATAWADTLDFQFTTVEGKTIRLSDYRGKWVLVNFWAHWCPLCWPEVPDLNALDRRDDFVVIGVGMDYGPDENAARHAIARYGLRYEALVLGGNRRESCAASHQVGPVNFYPTSYLYAPDGQPAAYIPGPLSEGRMLAFLSANESKALFLSSDRSMTKPAGLAPISLGAARRC